MEPLKEMESPTLCPERTEYQEFIDDPENRGKENYKAVKKALLESYKLAFYNYFAELYPYLRFEIGEERVYWNYNETSGLYEEYNSVTVKEWIIKLLIDEGLNATANDNFAKTVLARFRACYSDRGDNYDDFDADEDYFHADNGWVNLTTLNFTQHTPERLSRRKSAANYDKDAECPVYDKFLDVDLKLKSDQVRVIDQFSGLALTNDISHQKMLTIVGRPGCGKSTLLDSWKFVNGDTMIEKKLTELQGDSMRFAGAQFVSKRLCWFDEVDVKKAEMGNTLGTLITGQTINVERKGINGIVEARNTIKCVLTANRLPMSSEVGIFRRLILIYIQGSFVDDNTQDITIHKKLQTEASGILNRMLKGLHDIRKMGTFTMIEGHEDLVEEYKVASDTVAEFLDTYFEVGEDTDFVSSTQLFKSYQNFTDTNWTRSLTPQRFGQMLTTQPLTKFSHIEASREYFEGETQRVWRGLKLKIEYQFNQYTHVVETVSGREF